MWPLFGLVAWVGSFGLACQLATEGKYVEASIAGTVAVCAQVVTLKSAVAANRTAERMGRGE